MEGEKSVSKEKKFTLEQGLKIMELVTQIAVASARNEGTPQTTVVSDIEDVDKLVRTLFSTMCELLESLPPKKKPHVRTFST